MTNTNKPPRRQIEQKKGLDESLRNGRGRRPPRPADIGEVSVTQSEHHILATLDRPSAANRISAAMAQRLIELAEQAEDDPTVYAVVITGRGTTFCAGFETDVDPCLVETLALVSKPTLAVINGDALDEGLELAMALDLRAASPSSRFAMTQLERGMLPCFGGTQRLPRLIGAAHALRMILTGAALDGREAMRLGLVTYLAKHRADLDRLTGEIVATLTSRGPLGTRMVKDAVRNGYDMTLDQGIRLEEDLYALLQTTADRAEGVRAFLEKRKPLFKGV
ncbi:MAG TPA: enoyl-CoA hydratase/isomerase family protein [Candidatus Binataceae bacterium]|nr:enoyl-CoA hydratase/isomerase family protein [Candidatus Binataceae bacterium]